MTSVHMLVGWQEGHPACKKTMCCFVGGFARLIAPVVTTTITLSSNKVQNGDIIIIIIIIQAFLRCTLSASELNLRLRQSLDGEDG